MRKHRILKNEEPSKSTNNNPFSAHNSKSFTQPNLKINLHKSSTDQLLLKDLVNQQARQFNCRGVSRLAYVTIDNKIQIDEEALLTIQRFSSSQIAFVGIYGPKGSGKSFLLDKILNLAGIQGSHYCRASQDYEKGLYFYSFPFIKANKINVFLLDCVGFQLDYNKNSRGDDALLDLMMILCSSVIFMPSIEDLQGQIFKVIYDRISESTQRMTENKVPTTPEKQYWPKNAHFFLRNKQSYDNCEQLENLFMSCIPSMINDALPHNLRVGGIVNENHVVQYKNMNNLPVNGFYLKQAQKIMRQVMDRIYTKNISGLKFTGNIVCKLILTVTKHLNKKERIQIDKIFLSILKQLYESAFQYHTELYDEKLRSYFMKDDAFPMDYLINAFKTCGQSVMESFNKLPINNKIHREYEDRLERYIDEKEDLILKINRKKTSFILKSNIKQHIKLPESLTHKQQIFALIQSLQLLQEQLDHDRCSVLSPTLINLANVLAKKQTQDSVIRQQSIMDDLLQKIEKKKNLLEKEKQKSIQNVMMSTYNQKKYNKLVKEKQLLQSKIKSTKKEIEIEKKFQKQSMSSKLVAKQHAQQLLGFIRQLQERSRDNQKILAEINKEFEYNPTIELLSKRIEEKIRQQKDLQPVGSESRISHKHLKRKSQISVINSCSNISAIPQFSTYEYQKLSYRSPR